jgi:hypothetical protein
MEDLTKQQMVLLTVLVSFVCSVATSISIVALLTDAAQPVTQTINNVIEKTIEKVVTGTTTPVYVKQPPVVVKSESEKVITAVGINLPKIVVVRDTTKEGEVPNATSTAKLGIGAVVSPEGLIAADSSTLGEKTDFIIVFGDKYRLAKKVYTDTVLHLALLQTGEPTKGDTNTDGITFAPPAYMRGEMTLGLPLVALGGENGKSMIRGSLTELPDKKTSPLIAGDLALPESYKGGIVFSLDGNVLGFILSGTEGRSQIIYYTNILSVISDYKNSKPETPKL